MAMKFKIVAVTGLAVLGAAVMWMPISAHEVDGTEDKDRLSKSYDLSGFDAIEIGGVYNLDVTVGEAFRVDISGTPEDMDKIDVYVDGGALVLSQERRKGVKWNMNRGKEITAHISMPSLNALSIGGVGVGEIKGVESQTFDMSIGGVGEFVISGNCGTLEANVGGVGNMDLRDLKCKQADVSLAGVGEMSIYASERVKVSAAGLGSVDVYGNPKEVEKSKTFLSNVKIK